MEEHIGSLASLIGSLTVVGSSLLWGYNKFIGNPREKRRRVDEEKRQRRMLEVVTRENKPLNESIKQLTEWLHESKADRESLNRLAKEHSKDLEDHEARLDDHQGRLIVLETVHNIKKHLQFQGGE